MDQATLRRIDALPPSLQKAEFLKLVEDQENAEKIVKARDSFMGFVDYTWPAFIAGRHHAIMADAFDRIIDGSLKRLIINMGPRHTKSEFAAIRLPAKFMGHYPEKKIIQASNVADLAVDFGRKVRNMVDTDAYKLVFPNTVLTPDSKAAGKWTTSMGGEYFAVGIGGSVAGKGGDLVIIDDPHSEQDYIRALAGDASVFDTAFEWYQTGPRQRLQPQAAIVVVMTRWHMKDLTGRLIKRMIKGGLDQWELIEFPAILNEKSLWPEFWSIEELKATRHELTPQQWSAQYLQNPTSEEGALVKREWWKIWESDTPPECEYIIQSWDTAYKRTERSDYSACTTWGIFYMPDDEGQSQANIILLDAYKARLEFPALKRKCLELYKFWEPDATIIEAKASGLPLIYEMREIGVPVQEFTPSRGNDKVVRLNAVSDLFYSGVVWCPQTRWAEDVMDEVAGFPLADHDDYTDSTTQALLRFRQGGFIRLPSDEDDEPIKRQRREYY